MTHGCCIAQTTLEMHLVPYHRYSAVWIFISDLIFKNQQVTTIALRPSTQSKTGTRLAPLPLNPRRHGPGLAEGHCPHQASLPGGGLDRLHCHSFASASCWVTHTHIHTPSLYQKFKCTRRVKPCAHYIILIKSGNGNQAFFQQFLKQGVERFVQRF